MRGERPWTSVTFAGVLPDPGRPVVPWLGVVALKVSVVLLGSFAVSVALAVAVTRLRHISALFGVKTSAEWPVAGGTIGPGSSLPSA